MKINYAIAYIRRARVFSRFSERFSYSYSSVRYTFRGPPATCVCMRSIYRLWWNKNGVENAIRCME
jgi:hypothetical protein